MVVAGGEARNLGAAVSTGEAAISGVETSGSRIPPGAGSRLGSGAGAAGQRRRACVERRQGQAPRSADLVAKESVGTIAKV